MPAVTAAVAEPLADLVVDEDHGFEDRPLGTAVFTADRSYRYLLTRLWDPALPLAVFVMLNPSTAGARDNDPTITRCISFARREKAGGLAVVNLFARCATDPAALKTDPDPVGALADSFIDRTVARSSLVIAAWGAHGGLHGRADQVAARLGRRGIALRCFGTTKAGQPLHPLYLHDKTPLVPYAPSGA
ncbi:DUF1643 domain-containing protein (plasmid) [Streptomyces sp. NA02950]|uniref:DUF1643 domain-containing protein n=1 Tax=Streptomyces sp. NA02950 TaxID=2742137 RepID=UPI001590CA58|nr:DUF1643 domain-containing protein [Streptomyces sp. NA02950]QKV98159.1 DUF1643 domain-containing protein [Streptomyces sp. NA02950]